MDGSNDEFPPGTSSVDRSDSTGSRERLSLVEPIPDRVIQMPSKDDEVYDIEEVEGPPTNSMDSDPVGMWIARICWTALGGTLVNFLAILCVMGWRWVMNR